jgi:uncharacterized membrane protein
VNESRVTGSQWERLAPLAGVGFFILAFVGNVIPGEQPDFLDDPREYADYFVDKSDQVLVGMNLALVSLVLLIWFLGTLRRRLLRGETGDGQFSVVAYGAGLVATALIAAGFALFALAGLRAGEDDAINPDIAATLADAASVLIGLAAPVAEATLLFATAVVVLRWRSLPPWLGWLSLVLGVVGLIGPISWVLGYFLFPLWVLVTGVVIFVRERESASSAAAVGTTGAGTAPIAPR